MTGNNVETGIKWLFVDILVKIEMNLLRCGWYHERAYWFVIFLLIYMRHAVLLLYRNPNTKDLQLYATDRVIILKF